MRPITADDLETLKQWMHDNDVPFPRRNEVLACALNDLTGLAFLKDTDTYRPSTYLSSNGRTEGYDTVVYDCTCDSHWSKLKNMNDNNRYYWRQSDKVPTDCASE